eukprot:gene15537-18415_t
MKGVYADTIFDLIEKHTRGNTGKFIKYLPFVGALHELDGWEDYGDEENEDPEDQSDSPQVHASQEANPKEVCAGSGRMLSLRVVDREESSPDRGGRKPTSVMQEIEAFNRDQLARRKDGEMYEGYKRNKCPSPQRLTSRREIDDYNKPQLEESVDRRLHFKKREVTDKVTGSQGARILAGCPSALLKEIRPPPTSKAQLDAKVAQLARPIDMPSMTNIMAREQDAVAAKRRATGDMLRRTWSEQTVEKERLRSAQQKSEATWPYVATSSVPSRRAKLRSTCM